ncbi:prolyl oligopeptidase family protein [Corynebacterium sp. HS2168-gen11]|uniref:prolyl oligopeptidase family serine peptidase n=1 Tax=Corynebacterium sp. HS2168-gen11 TaxID=2974027 RepID=UPI00216AE5F7|nr:prolyl oligopeptidase family serine peptidase [Corynebacterium sp. HS2168-gen11]MCS4535608.1 prolyl oligopeptidase family serine peptidase [Corynebacterium sp. HS2168-gen11]
MTYDSILVEDTRILETIDNPAAIAWSAKMSARTAKLVDKQLATRLFEALVNDERIIYVVRRGEYLYNYWRDDKHLRGQWRRTSYESYRSADPQWDVLIDLDELAHREKENWVWKGSIVRDEQDLALIKLSRGGSDANVVREFDMHTREFVPGGFELPEARSQVSWVDRDTLLVSTDFGPDSLTDSGYPARAHLWRRGVALADSEELFCGKQSDLLITAWADTDPGFERIFISRNIDFYTTRRFIVLPHGLQVLEVPENCEVSVYKHWMFVMPREPYQGIPAGGLGVINFDEFLAGSRDYQVIFQPTAHKSLQNITFTRDNIILTTLEDVASSLVRMRLGTWELEHIAVPPLTSARVITADIHSDEIWIGAASFTQPDTLYRVTDTTVEEITHAPALFDATGLEVRQHWATSADGTQVPYFIVGRFDAMGQQRPRPTLVKAYGGFEVSLMPGYMATLGIGWLEHDHYYVQPNIRGGGEFGPAWHHQATKTNRHKVYEDHQAVLDDLVARGYSTPASVYVRGASNGGLLAATALTQYPEKIGGAIIQVPLTDMLRYHTWSAGASWIAEYGDPRDPAEYAALAAYSPLAHVPAATQQQLPPALITTSTLDDRVHPAHARLFAHALAAAGQSVAYFENTEGGHAGAADNAQTAFMESLVYSWIHKHLTQD